MTLATVVTDVRRIVQDEPWESVLTGSYTAPATTLTIATFADLERGFVLDFSEDGTLEQFRVSAEPSSSTVSVKPAHNNTTNSNHANGAVFSVNPRYGSDQISKAITHIVNTRLWPDLWIVVDSSITPTPTTTNIYDLPADYEDIIELVQVGTGSIEDLVLVPIEREIRIAPDAVSASNKALRITRWPRTDANATLWYRTRVTTANMTAEMEPVIALGTAAYLLRTETQEKLDRPDEDDRPGRMQRAARDLERLFEEEKTRLRMVLGRQWNQARYFRKAARTVGR